MAPRFATPAVTRLHRPGAQSARTFAVVFCASYVNAQHPTVLDLGEPRPPGNQAGDGAPRQPGSAEAGPGIPPRNAEVQLLASIRESLASLEALLERASDHWGREDAVHRCYHQRFKVFAIQSLTLAIVTALQRLLPGQPLCPPFKRIIDEGTGKGFSPDDNRCRADSTRPMLEAFFHAQYFLEMVVTYGRQLASPPRVLPSGWAAVLTLYGLR